MDKPRGSSAGLIVYSGFIAGIVVGALVWYSVKEYVTALLLQSPEGGLGKVPGLLGLAAGLTVWVPMMALALIEWNREYLSWAGPPSTRRSAQTTESA